MNTIKTKIISSWQFLKKVHPNYIVFSLFFAISSFFWVLNALGKTYTLTVPYTIEYQNIPEKFTSVESSQQQIMVEQTGSGYSFLKYYLFDTYFVIPVDVTEFVKDTNKTSHKIKIPTYDFLSKMHTELFEIHSVEPETISNTISKIIQKKVPVRANLSMTCKDNYGFTAPHTLEPDSIELEGAKVVLDTVKYVYTELLEREDLNSSFSVSLNLVPIPGVKFEKSYIQFSSEVDEKLFHIIEVPIDLSSVPEKEQRRISESFVIVSYAIFSSEYDESMDTTIKAVASYSKNSKKEKHIPISIQNVPKGITVLSVQPSELTYFNFEK